MRLQQPGVCPQFNACCATVFPLYCDAGDPAFARMVRHLNIFGRVQGVGFRYRLMEEAQYLGITGWVRNRRGGSVEAVIAGAPEAVEAMLAWARQGPAAARVDRVELGEAGGTFSSFELRPSE
jgi:acylphosphatase